ncbi:siderophore ABC transporter substrate-binding protein [Massilia sp.]|uniref:siderophore ABC transporter substrate-binding protein n=1 Tax=Massilia sp. TaxID=1882437 RepID=UPI00289C2C37|nr:siderophore ABC transporter substrate-binding protein [Massilia sp.]
MTIKNTIQRRRAIVAIGAAFSLALGALPAQAQSTVQVKHASGTTAVPVNPKKVVVLDATTLDNLSALDVNVAGVPTMSTTAKPLPRHLARYNAAQKVGTLFEPDYEKIFGLKPDLIIVGGRSQAKYAELAKIAPTLDMTVDRTKLLDSAKANVTTLGNLFGKQARAKELTGKLDASIANLKSQAANAGTGLIVLTTGGKMSAYGPGSRFGILHDSFGIKPAVGKLDTSNHGQAISFEFIQKTNPDWLFVIDRDAAIGREGASAAKFLDNELVRQSTAWKNKQVVYLDGFNWYTLGGAGITAMQENVDQLSKALSAKSGR